ncbi:MAG: 3-hydroxyacyl-CoA dehydrogenase [Steroidobacteraceae bacterium]|nr:3-hydroxyacyl-CoA dehydrogenase [Nevskiaceae bacterium]MCP5340027.1 3-hydroxyacyl-CoA dehydrogenase [Nevskiaceae bacterium]MCP5359251.1 3-hydroxyacyl-CoA dehydrogenase [Nevskiaceae bacterium]MCP5466484.1 3-hydroxyacyl-CoA dehydrogenase [Nevskiaceae bacterium]MCP5471813.1 3-hydroxyacyl-CoA dehydrogenase [Nevskiaceae bacterium]
MIGVEPLRRVALVGAGLVGSGWAIVFARAGFEVVLHDAAPGQAARALQAIAVSLADLEQRGLLQEPVAAVAARIRVADELSAALAGVDYVQESIVERLEAKRPLYAQMDAIAAPGVILASSTSAFPTSAIAEGLRGAARCVVAHPVNPPYLVPLVEVSGAPFTAESTIERTLELQRAAGQAPIRVRREIRGFVLNRLQWTLLAEACRLVADGVASVDDVDAAIRDGLGRRWVFMGPFEVGDLNAPGGLRDYLERFGPTIEQINAAAGFRLEPAQIEALHTARRALLPEPARAERSRWRDRRLMALARHLDEAATEKR